MRGGHSRSGRAQTDEATRALRGTPERARHREKAEQPGQPMMVCEPPPGLSEAELQLWNFYAPQLAGRLTLSARDVLAKYVCGLALIAGLRRELASPEPIDQRHAEATRKELRQWVLAMRLYENDLLLSPAAVVRAPKNEFGETRPNPLDRFLNRRRDSTLSQLQEKARELAAQRGRPQ